jgi:hypothetical protein
MKTMSGTENNKKKGEDNIDVPLAKKLRIGDPDIKVIVRHGEDVEREYLLYSPVIAGLSNFFDTSLSVEMREKATREIILHDVEPALFEKALRLQVDLKAVRSMTPRDAIEVVGFYDRYEFVDGLELCDDVLEEYISNVPKKSVPAALDLFVRVVALSHQHNLPKAVMAGAGFLHADMWADNNHPFGSLPLSEEHVQLLLPLWQVMQLNLPADLSTVDTENPLYAKYFLKCRAAHFLNRAIMGRIRLVCDGKDVEFGPTGSGKFLASSMIWSSYEGFVSRLSSRLYSSYPATDVELKKATQGRPAWLITNGEELLLECSVGYDIEYPPCGPWIPVHPTLDGKYAQLHYD